MGGRGKSFPHSRPGRRCLLWCTKRNSFFSEVSQKTLRLMFNSRFVVVVVLRIYL